MSNRIFAIDDFDIANVTAKYNEIEEKGPELKISKGTVFLHFLRKSIRYKENKSYKETNEGEEISKESADEFPDYETFYAPLRPGYLYVKIFHGNDADTDYLEFQITEIGTLLLKSKSKGQIWTDKERDSQSVNIPYLTLDKKSVAFAAYSEVKWKKEYAEEQFFNPSACLQYFDANKWYKEGNADWTIKGEAYQNTYYLHTPTKIAFDDAYKGYMANKDDWDYEEDAFLVLKDALGQVSDLCYEILHSNLSITAAMMAPLLGSTTDELLEHIDNGTLNQIIENSPDIDPTTISVEQTDLKAREKARKAIYDAKIMILSQIDNNSPSERANIELYHYLKNDLLQGKFRVLQISRFLLTPADLVDFMIKDEQSDPDPGIGFIEDFFASDGYLTSLYYSILTKSIDFDIYKLSKTHYAYWSEVIDIFGAVAIYKDIFADQNRFLNILTSVNLKNGETSCSKRSFYKKERRFHVEDYVLDLPDSKIRALEEKNNAKLPQNRRLIYPETEFANQDNWAESFDVKTLVFNYEGLMGMDELNGLRDESKELFDLVNRVNQKAVAWVSEEILNDENIPAHTVRFTSLDDYAQHITKRQFGITGNNPNGIVFPDPRGSDELVYTGIVSDKWSPFYYKVYAMPYKMIRGINCEINPNKMPSAVSKYIRINEYSDIHSIKLSNPTELWPEPFNFDGTLNRACINSDSRIKSRMLKSDYVSENEKADILTMSIHQAQNDFINHPVTKGAIFILTSVITAGMMQGVAAGSRMLCRNAFKAVAKKALVGSGKFSAETILTKAIVSVGYQTITQKGQVNLFTVIGDSFFTPFVGAALGNAFTVNFNILELRLVDYNTIFKKNTDTKFLLAAITRTLIAGTLHKYGGETMQVGNIIFDTGTQIVIRSNENAMIQGLGKLIEE